MKYITLDRVDYIDSPFSIPDNPHSHDFCHMVFGHNRSGTTIACKILEALKIDILYTAEVKAMGVINEKRAGVRYRELSDFDIFPAYYKIASNLGRSPAMGYKQLIPMNRCDISFLQNVPCKVIVCRRDFKAISESHASHFGSKKQPSEKELARSFVSEWGKLTAFAYDLHDIYFEELISDPEKTITEVAEFVGLTNPEHIKNAVALVDPSRKRF